MSGILNQLGSSTNEGQENQAQTVKLDIDKSVNELTSIDGKENPEPETTENLEAEKGSKFPQRKRREINKCPHTDKKHYAKNMCHNCYHRRGKTKMATCCPTKSHYSGGMCQNCYLAKYYQKRKDKIADKKKAKSLKVSQTPAQMSDDLEASTKRQK